MTKPLLYRLDPVFKTWNTVEDLCHRKIKQAHPQLRSYLIDAMPESEILLVQQQKYIAITNSIIDNSFGNIESILRVSDTFYGVYYYPYLLTKSRVDKNFNCFINRMDPIRQSWLYQLVRRGLFDKGYVSFNMDITRIPNFKNLTQIQAFEQQFQEYGSIFSQEHDQIKDLVPYKNFSDNGDITNIVLGSKFSIVLETYFHNNHVVTYSEKIFRCLQLPRPWIIFSHQHAVAHLRIMGFDLLDDIVNHDQYDQLESAIQRQIKLLDLAEQLVTIDIDKCYNRLSEAAQHNQNLMKQFSATWMNDFDNTIQLALKKLNV
jgi:hypothetical protein